MKLFTKILSLVLCLCIVASLAACGGNGGKTTVDENQTDFYVVGGMSALSGGYDSNTVLNKMQEDAGITIEWKGKAEDETGHCARTGKQLVRVSPKFSCTVPVTSTNAPIVAAGGTAPATNTASEAVWLVRSLSPPLPSVWMTKPFNPPVG